MNWATSKREAYQVTADGEAKAHEYYYLYKVTNGDWRAGRKSYGQEIDFRLKFSSASVARWYCEKYDSEKEALIITAM